MCPTALCCGCILIAVCINSLSIRLFSRWIITITLQDGSQIKLLVGHASWVHCMVVDPVHRYLWSGSVDGIRIWDPALPTGPPVEDEVCSHAGHLALVTAHGLTESLMLTFQRRHRGSVSLNRQVSHSQLQPHSRDRADSKAPAAESAWCLAALKVHDGAVLSMLVVDEFIWSGELEQQSINCYPDRDCSTCVTSIPQQSLNTCALVAC